MKTTKELQSDIDYWTREIENLNAKLREANHKLSDRITEFREASRAEQREQQNKMKPAA